LSLLSPLCSRLSVSSALSHQSLLSGGMTYVPCAREQGLLMCTSWPLCAC
jgi:hypothetical protein